MRAATATPPRPAARLTARAAGTVTALIMQKTGAGLHVASSCFWDNTLDGAPRPAPACPAAHGTVVASAESSSSARVLHRGTPRVGREHATAAPRRAPRGSAHRISAAAGSATLKWENKTMYCIATVYGLAI